MKDWAVMWTTRDQEAGVYYVEWFDQKEDALQRRQQLNASKEAIVVYITHCPLYIITEVKAS